MWVEPLNRPNAARIVRMVYDAFGPDRLMWAGYGGNLQEFDKRLKALEEMFSFASEEDRQKIRGLNAMKLFNFPM
jgi:predicted TIM-barrel fold metal-dependent hydrolase